MCALRKTRKENDVFRKSILIKHTGGNIPPVFHLCMEVIRLIKSKLNPPNLLSTLRIVLSVVMLAAKECDIMFYTAYAMGGISDMLDGYVARKLNCCTSFGERLDSMADIVFSAAALFGIINRFAVPAWAYIMAAMAAGVRISAYIACLLKQRKFAPMHTKLNKAAGIICFLLLAGCAFIGKDICLATAGALAIVSAIDELFRTLRNKKV